VNPRLIYASASGFGRTGPYADKLAFRADTGDLTQSTRLLLDDIKHGFAKGAHKLLGIDRSNAADHAGAEIFLDPLDCRWCRGLEKRGPELDAMRAVIDPGPARLNEFAGRDHRGMADEGDQVALAAGFDTQNAEAVLCIVERDAVDQRGQDFGWGACPRCFRHRLMMENKVVGRYAIKPPAVCGRARLQ
jgi:hypothetical protein